MILLYKQFTHMQLFINIDSFAYKNGLKTLEKVKLFIAIGKKTLSD